jgi:hypothetical protein
MEGARKARLAALDIGLDRVLPDHNASWLVLDAIAQFSSFWK